MMEHNLLLDAWKQGKAIGAFNANTYDDMEAIVQAAAELNRPVILMASMSCCRFMGIDTFVAFAKHLEKKYRTKVITHLDHCTEPDLLYRCVDAGFDYVMFDGSNRSFEENCEMTAKIVKDCHEKGVFVEGELGVISGTEGPLKSDTGVFTDPEQMKEFIARTNLDTLAVSIGNQHGFYKGEPKLNFELLEVLAKESSIPLVLHGGTGIPVEDIARAVGMGICKVNVGPDLRATYLRTVAEYGKNWDGKNDIRGYITCLRDEIKKVAKYYMVSYS